MKLDVKSRRRNIMNPAPPPFPTFTPSPQTSDRRLEQSFRLACRPLDGLHTEIYRLLPRYSSFRSIKEINDKIKTYILLSNRQNQNLVKPLK